MRTMSFRRVLPFGLLVAVACSGGGSEATDPNDASAAETALDGQTQGDADASALDGSGTGEAGDGGDDVSLFPADDGGLRDFPLPDIPTSCTAARVFMYAPNGYATLLDALEADHTACADYYVHVAADPTDKTKPRGGGVPNAIRARQGRFHAVAELNWTAWSASSALTWLEKGAEFRARMDAAGYNVARGDTWAIVELPASVRTDATLRGNVRDLLHGLQSPGGTAISRQGFVMISSQPQSTNVLLLPSYRSQMEAFLSDGAFWTQIGAATIGFGEEAWIEPARTCVSGAPISTLSDNVNAYAEHPAILAQAGPASAANAKTALASVYFPVLDAALGSSTYFTSSLSLAQMQAYVSLQVYANRAYADGHPTPGRRIGFLWDDAPKTVGTPTDLKTLATRLAASIRAAYDPSGTASAACAGGATTSCQCVLAGATFNTGWSTFGTW
jgi:hypothetical protein